MDIFGAFRDALSSFYGMVAVPAQPSLADVDAVSQSIRSDAAKLLVPAVFGDSYPNVKRSEWVMREWKQWEVGADGQVREIYLRETVMIERELIVRPCPGGEARAAEAKSTATVELSADSGKQHIEAVAQNTSAGAVHGSLVVDAGPSPFIVEGPFAGGEFKMSALEAAEAGQRYQESKKRRKPE